MTLPDLVESEYIARDAMAVEESRAVRDDKALALRRAVGARLKELRVERGLTLTTAAKRAGLSRSFVAMVESGTTEIAFSRLIRLADAYDTALPDLLEPVPTTSAELVRAGAGPMFPSGVDGVTIRYLSASTWEVQSFVVELASGARLEDLRHPGDEFLHCLAGRPTVTVDGVAHELRHGDTVTLPSRAVHSYANTAARTARLVGGAARLPESVASDRIP